MRASTAKLARHFREDVVFRNSFFLMASTVVMGSFGLVFWTLASHTYTTSEVGLTTSLSASAMFLSTGSMLGLNTTLIRYLPRSLDRGRLASAALSVALATSLAVGCGFAMWSWLSSSPAFGRSERAWLLCVFVVYVVSITVNGLLDSIFIASQCAQWVLLKNAIMSACRPLLLVALTALGALGILSSISLAALLALVLGFLLVRSRLDIRLTLQVSPEEVNASSRFAIANYVGSLFGIAPASLLPLIVVSRLGATKAAFLYMPMMIVALLTVIPSATAQALFAEMSYERESLVRKLRPALVQLALLLVPAASLAILFAPLILWPFGPEYVRAGAGPLRVLAIASVLGGFSFFGDAVLNIQHRSWAYSGMAGLNAMVTLCLAYALAPQGLMAIAVGVLVAQAITVVIYVIVNRALVSQVISSQVAVAGQG
ncbi:hypothetical protein acdb102_19510 [Acidothermaceae bacterium B102]|nr:hypothetical protein acdb102_19510 [Acidothermaceae bacterium B102]